MYIHQTYKQKSHLKLQMRQKQPSSHSKLSHKKKHCGIKGFNRFYPADDVNAIIHAHFAVVFVVPVVRVVVNPHTSHGEMHLVMPTLPYSPIHLKKTDLNRAVPLCILLLFCAFLQEKRGYPTPENAILHPILHPKSPVNTGILGYGCRKCRIFFQNFFRGGREETLVRELRREVYQANL